MAVCQEYSTQSNSDQATAGELWIQALTYFRDLPPPQDEIYLERALSAMSNISDKEKNKDKKDEVLSPLLVLEILQNKPKLKFSVIKKYLVNRLDVQDRVIKKHTKQVDENMDKIKKMRQEIQELKTQAKNFNPKNCDSCKNSISLPMILFMCGHAFHDQCIESDAGQRYCPVCYNEHKEVIEKKEQYNEQAKDPQQFYRDLSNNAKKFHVISQYFGRGLFNEMNQLD